MECTYKELWNKTLQKYENYNKVSHVVLLCNAFTKDKEMSYLKTGLCVPIEQTNMKILFSI